MRSLLCRATFPGLPIALCTWHVKRCWIKSLNTHASGNQPDRHEMFNELCAIMEGAASRVPHGVTVQACVSSELQAFYAKWGKKYPGLISYIQNTWEEEVCLWVTAFRDGSICCSGLMPLK